MPDVPAPTPGSSLPVRLDRAALERVLARASELQASTSGEPDEELTEEQIIDLGKEVGLSPQHLRQALAEERTRVAVPEETQGLAARLFGAAHASASRTVAGTPRDVLAAIDGWMQKTELLLVKRQFADRILWEPRNDVFVALRRALDTRGRSFALARAHEISATVIAVDESRVLVRLDADLTTQRSRHASNSLALTGFGLTAGIVLATIGFFPAMPFLPVVVPTIGGAVLGVYGSRNLNMRQVAAAQLALEQLLDRLERGELTQPARPSLLGVLTAAAAALPRR